MSQKLITAQQVAEAKIEIIRRCGNYTQNLRLDGIIMEVNFTEKSIIDPITWFLARRKLKRIQPIFDDLVFEVERHHERKMEEINRWLDQLLAHEGKTNTKKHRRVALREMKERFLNGNPLILCPEEPLHGRGYIAAIEDLINLNEHPAHQVTS